MPSGRRNSSSSISPGWVGGRFMRRMSTAGFVAEVGGLMYGFDLDAIIGCDFLRRVGAVVDLGRMEIRAG